MKTLTLTKRPFIEDEQEEIYGGVQMNPMSFQNKRPIRQEISYKRPSVFPRIDLSVDELIEMTGKTEFTREDVKELMTQAVRIHERKIRDEFEKTLTEQLQQQYTEFAIYQRDYLMKQYGESNATYFN